MKVSKDINENLLAINKILPVEKSFDIIAREIIVDNKKSFILFVDGFIKDTKIIPKIPKAKLFRRHIRPFKLNGSFE